MPSLPISLPRSRGFTLFELLIVLLLLGVAAGLAGIGMQRGLARAAEQSALNQMVNALRAARVHAIVTGQPAQARFDLDARTVKGPVGPASQWPASLHLRLHTAQALGAAYEFYPDGGASGGNIGVSDGARAWRIDVAWLTGSVRLRELP